MKVADAIRVLAGVAPDLAGRVATFAVSLTNRRSPRADERAVLEQAKRFEVAFGRHRIAAWAWGAGPIVHLMHGWNGDAGQLAAFVAPLVGAGMKVVAHDAVGHGASTGKASNVVAMADGLAQVVRTMGRAHAVVAHSLGGAAAAIAISRGLRVDRATFIGAPSDSSRWPEQVFGLRGASADRARSHAESKMRARYEDLSMRAIGRLVRTPLLVVHDQDDGVVPFPEALETVRVFRDAGLLATHGLGHVRVLRDAIAIEEIVRFVAPREPSAQRARALLAPPAGIGIGCSFRSLFARNIR